MALRSLTRIFTQFKTPRRFLHACTQTRRKQRRLTVITVSICFMFFTLFYCQQANIFFLVYVRPSRGILPYIFSDQKLIQARLYSVDTEFRYPLEINFTELLSGKTNERQTHAINKHPFRYIYSSPLVCKDQSSTTIQLVVLVKSAVTHFALRNVIRKTWGNFDKKNHFRLAFLLGYNRQAQFLVNNEYMIYKDIIQENFYDAYMNNTIKTIMGYNWVVRYCDTAQYVFFVDDDVFVNIDLVQKYLKSVATNDEQDLFSGILCTRGIPVRDPESKWYVSWEDYPFDFYPAYLAGAAIIASQNVVRKFQSAFPFVKYMPFDDVYLGIVARKLSIQLLNNTLQDNTNLRNFRQLSSLMTNHGFDDPDLYLKTYESLYGKVSPDYDV